MIKTLRNLAAVLLLVVATSFAQQSNPDIKVNSTTFDVFGLNPAPVPGATLTVVGQTGNARWYFWASANFQLGSVISPLGSVGNAANTLSSSNYVQIIPFAYPPGASTVDILATTTPVAPSGACNCAVATGLTSGGTNFTSNTLSSYTVTILNPPAYNLSLTDEVVGSGSTHLLLRNAFTHALISDLSNVGSGNLPTGCSSGQTTTWNGTTWICSTGGTGTITGSGTAGLLAVFSGTSAIGSSNVASSAGGFSVGGTVALNPSGNGHAVFFGVEPTGTCTGTNAIPLPVIGCIGDEHTMQPQNSGSIGTTAGLEILANANAGPETLQIGLYSSVQSGSAAITEQRAVYAEAVNATAHAITTARGLFAIASNHTSNTTASNQAIYAITDISASGSVNTSDADIYLDSPQIAAGGVLTHHYAIYIADPTVAGSGTNSDPWSIYSVAGANFLGGNLTVGGSNVTFSGLSGLPSSGRFCLDIGSTGQIFVTTSDCGSGGGGGGANTALSNLSAVSINTSLLAQAGVDLGSTSNPFRNLYLYGGGTYGTDSFELTGTSTQNRVVTFPDNSGTVAELNLAQTYSALQTFSTNISIGGQALSGGVQGTGDTKALLASTVAGTGVVLCTDSNGGATTSGCPSSGFSPTITSPQQTQTLVYNGTAWVNGYGGVNVDPQTGNYTLACPTDRLGEIEFNISSAATLTLPQAGSTTCLQSNYAVVVRNTSSSTAILTLTATTSTFQPENVSSLSAVPGAAYFVYSDATTSTGNYHAVPIATAPGGVNIQTGNYTMTLLDKDRLVVMNCNASCTVTFPATPPSTKWNAGILSIGSTTATVALNSLDYNGGPSAPALIKFMPIRFTTDGSNYFGDAPLVAGTGVTLTPANNGVTVTSTASGSGAPATVTLLSKTATYAGASSDFSSGTAPPTMVEFSLSAIGQTYTLLSSAPAEISGNMPCVIVKNVTAPYYLQVLTGGSTTIDGVAFATVGFPLAAGQSEKFCSDGTNYHTEKGLGVGQFLTTGLGGQYVPSMIAGTIGAGVLLAANEPQLTQFVLTHSQQISHITQYIQTGVAGGTCDAGIYDSSLNLLVHTGTTNLVCTTASNTTAVKAATTSTVILPPGVYYYAVCASSVTVSWGGMSSFTVTAEQEAAATSTQGTGPAASCTTGALPSTLASVTNVAPGNFNVLPVGWITP